MVFNAFSSSKTHNEKKDLNILVCVCVSWIYLLFHSTLILSQIYEWKISCYSTLHLQWMVAVHTQTLTTLLHMIKFFFCSNRNFQSTSQKTFSFVVAFLLSHKDFLKRSNYIITSTWINIIVLFFLQHFILFAIYSQFNWFLCAFLSKWYAHLHKSHCHFPF